MKLTKKQYLDRAEKRKDFWLGVVIFIVLNTLMFLALLLLTRIQRGTSSDVLTFIYLLLNLLPYAINIGLLIYFAFTRSWIALGMLAVYGFLVALALLAGIVFLIFCFVSLSTGL